MSKVKIPMLGSGRTSAGPIENPYEVRSASGLEGIYASADDAEFHADELRKEGVPDVKVEKRRRPSFADRAVAARALREEEQAAAAYSERAAQTTSPELRQVYEHAGKEEEQHAWMLRPFATNPSGRLFAGVYPTGIVYADRAREVDGDYMRVAFLPYSSLRLQWSPGNHPPELRAEVERDAAAIIARRGQPFEISSSGQTVILGGAAARPPGAPPQYHVPQGRPPGVPNPARRRDTEVPIAGMGRSVVGLDPHGEAYVIDEATGVSFMGPTADAWASKVGLEPGRRASHSNPAGLTAKGERMYEDIKRGYEERGEPRAAEIASRTVLARASEGVPGLKRKGRR